MQYGGPGEQGTLAKWLSRMQHAQICQFRCGKKTNQTKPNQTLAPSQSQFLVTYFASEFYLRLCFFPACPPQTPALATLTNLMPVTKKLREADALALVGCHEDPVPNSILHILMWVWGSIIFWNYDTCTQSRKSGKGAHSPSCDKKVMSMLPAFYFLPNKSLFISIPPQRFWGYGLN